MIIYVVFFLIRCFCKYCLILICGDINNNQSSDCCKHDNANCWKTKVIHFYNGTYFNKSGIPKLQYLEDRKPMVVLSLFDGISSGESNYRKLIDFITFFSN